MANISIKQLKVFVTITQHSTMTAAAEALFLSKAAVSMALGEMEKQLGHSLFDRVNNRLIINQEGQKLLPLADEILHRAASIDELFSDDHSLKRLQTDYIDLYQLHWPERPTNYFGKRGYDFKRGDLWKENFQEVLDALQGHVVKGNIRYIGLSNETPWGTMGFLNASSSARPRVRTIQNPYSLLNRTFEAGNAEVSHRENVGLLAYSPLAFGVLSGKYRQGQKPEKARLTLFPHYDRYSSAPCNRAVELYHNLAISNGMTLTQLALAFVNDRPFVTSNIIGATNLSQLEENIGTARIQLGDQVLEAINQIHESIPNPST